MTRFNDAEAVTDEAENKAVRLILTAFENLNSWEQTLSKYRTVHQGSRLAADDDAMPHYPVSQFAYSQLVVAFGCLHSLQQMLVSDDGDSVKVTSGPFGPYALVRNALDSAACALWLLEPMNSKLRVKRRIQAQMGEIHNAYQFRKELSLPSHDWARSYRRRMQEVADQSNSGRIDVTKLQMPPTSTVLKDIERHHEEPVMSWLGAWQLCSGHAHGKQWATLMSNELEEIARTATDLGAEFRITVSYGSLAVVMASTLKLIKAACERYSHLAKDHQATEAV